MTKVLPVDAEFPANGPIAQAAVEILRGRLVAFPTETVYGLGANAFDGEAVERIFTAKGRPRCDPLIIHIESAGELARVASEIPPIARVLAGTFWPGPLTLILRKHRAVPAIVTAGLETVAVRVPAHPVAQALLHTSAVPIAAPSANRFSYASPTSAQHVLADLGGRIDLILDAGPTPIGVESTVLDVTRVPAVILRPGATSPEALEAVLGEVVRSEDAASQPDGHAADERPLPSPGLLAKHYAPRAVLILCQGPMPTALAHIARLARENWAAGRRVGLLLADEDWAHLDVRPVRPKVELLGSAEDLAQVARSLYAALRRLDVRGVDVILARSFGEEGLGLAIRDRLRRAASQVIE